MLCNERTSKARKGKKENLRAITLAHVVIKFFYLVFVFSALTIHITVRNKDRD